MEHKPPLVLTEQTFPHPRPLCPSGTLEREKCARGLSDAKALEAGGQQHGRGIVVGESVGFSQFACVSLGPVQIGFVNENEVSKFELARFFSLYPVASCWPFHHHDSVRNGSAA